MSRSDAISLAYVATIIAFILALRFLSSPVRAPLGNRIGALGMVIAIAATFVQRGIHNYWSILIVMALSAPIGAYAARAVKMTAMPQMVALFNGVGGGAAALVALADFHHVEPDPGRIKADVGVSIMLSALIGGISFAGSLVAFAKLQELVSGRPIVYPGQKLFNAALLTILVGRAMNRSLANVLFGAFGQIIAGPAGAAATDGVGVRSTSPDDVAVMLAYAKRVVIVPGYGLAVAQAQHDVRSLADLLEA